MQVSYIYDGHGSAKGLYDELANLVGKSSLTYVPDVGEGAWESTLRSTPLGTALGVSAFAHRYTVSVTSIGTSAAGDEQLTRIAVDDWSSGTR